MTSMHDLVLDDGDHHHCCDGSSHIECKPEFHSHALSLQVLAGQGPGVPASPIPCSQSEVQDLSYNDQSV
jgi:hypothetical protein